MKPINRRHNDMQATGLSAMEDHDFEQIAEYVKACAGEFKFTDGKRVFETDETCDLIGRWFAKRWIEYPYWKRRAENETEIFCSLRDSLISRVASAIRLTQRKTWRPKDYNKRLKNISELLCELSRIRRPDLVPESMWFLSLNAQHLVLIRSGNCYDTFEQLDREAQIEAPRDAKIFDGLESPLPNSLLGLSLADCDPYRQSEREEQVARLRLLNLYFKRTRTPLRGRPRNELAQKFFNQLFEAIESNSAIRVRHKKEEIMTFLEAIKYSYPLGELAPFTALRNWDRYARDELAWSRAEMRD